MSASARKPVDVEMNRREISGDLPDIHVAEAQHQDTLTPLRSVGRGKENSISSAAMQAPLPPPNKVKNKVEA
jgi:hypothetical protein